MPVYSWISFATLARSSFNSFNSFCFVNFSVVEFSICLICLSNSLSCFFSSIIFVSKEDLPSSYNSFSPSIPSFRFVLEEPFLLEV